MKDHEKTHRIFPEGGPTPSDMLATPEAVGRYRIESILGDGGFGRVYLAYDEELQRTVAVKVPHVDRIRRPEDVEAFLEEARNLARLDHPHIVPVYDFGRTDNGLCYVVSKVIEGNDLGKVIRSGRPPFHESAKLIATIAEALHHSHGKGLVHRDVKPNNILIDTASNAYLADFGLALREEDFGKGMVFVGSPAYMSPEQARGEGHRVDGRCDIFSLGVVFYEMLTGRRPFQVESLNAFGELIQYDDPPPPRKWDGRIPKELERICLKALAVRASDRFSTAFDMASDLRKHLGDKTRSAIVLPDGVSGLSPYKVVPKGLSSFDAHDANFFLELLPGPRDRDGLPESIRFWKARIEAEDLNRTFGVGLIYGPSGCGKSSLVKAGLLPCLDKRRVRSLYVEATADDTEARLLTGLRRVCIDLPADLSLVQTLAHVRKAQASSTGPKVVIVIDQFEQWLHAHKEDPGAELIQALRQCDGLRLMCLLLVRDDFWLSVSRFMKALEVRLLEGENTCLVDLFDIPHARKVLALFGTAFGALSDTGRTREQDAFLDQAVAGLAEDGKVISVRLAIFAEMVKKRPWTATTLKEIGGTKGVGVAFLDASFMVASSSPKHRLHRPAAQAILKALLPESGSNIKGSMRSYQELMDSSGYADRPHYFAHLMQILIGEMRLIAPTTAENRDADTPEVPTEARYYQLTHDYMVPSLREWLTRQQMHTWRGRAERRLADRTALWRFRQERRQLPSMVEWLQIRNFTAPRTWTEPERRMMQSATKKHLTTLTWVCAFGGLIFGLGLLVRSLVVEDRATSQAHALVMRLLDANIAETPAIIQEIAEHRRLVDPELQQTLSDPQLRPERRLRAMLGLFSTQPELADKLRKELLDSEVVDFPIIRDALSAQAAQLSDGFWNLLETQSADPRARFRAAAALASYDPENSRWKAMSRWIADQLVSQPSLVLPKWVEILSPARGQLTGALAAKFMEEPTTMGAEILTDYAADQFDLQVRLVARSQPDSFAILFPRMAKQPAQAIESLTAALDQEADKTQTPNESAAARANMAIALLRLGVEDRLWPLLKMSPDPRCRSYIIDRLGPMGCPADVLLRRLSKKEKDFTAPLLLALGRYDEQMLPAAKRAALTATIMELYRTDNSSEIHSAARWLAGHWGQQCNDVELKDNIEPKGKNPSRRWYVNSEGITMIRFQAPGTFTMGTPADAPDWTLLETQHQATIDYDFDVGMTEVTVGQFRRFLQDPKIRDNKDLVSTPPGASPDTPMAGVPWFQAVAYCNWLSEKEGVPKEQWCYEPNAEGKYSIDMKISPGYHRRRGYRLPTEGEWEYACRGGAATKRDYGDADELLPRYAWFSVNSSEKKWPVATLRPNAYGLFDMLGNATEWCQERVYTHDDHPGGWKMGETVQNDKRAIRSSHSLCYARLCKSAKRWSDAPFTREAAGFRLTRSSP